MVGGSIGAGGRAAEATAAAEGIYKSRATYPAEVGAPKELRGFEHEQPDRPRGWKWAHRVAGLARGLAGRLGDRLCRDEELGGLRGGESGIRVALHYVLAVSEQQRPRLRCATTSAASGGGRLRLSPACARDWGRGSLPAPMIAS
jgi:hypothetical protein